MHNSLEQEIATALVATEISSSDLSQLLVEAEAAIAAADNAAEDERARRSTLRCRPMPKWPARRWRTRPSPATA